MAAQTPAQQLNDLLVSRNFDPELLDSAGKPSQNPSETEVFSFDFQTESGNDYGTVVIMLGDENNMEIYFGDNIGRGMETDDKKEWFDFLYQLRMFAKRNLLTFGLKNLNRLRYSMQGQAAIKEGLFESWQGKKDVSWNAGPNESRLMIKHKRSLGEGEARFRYVESLFIETAEGERYKLPFKNLTAGKAMLEHVRNGGRPYDVRGQHIAEMVSDLTVLSRFRRANHGKLLEGDTAQLVEQTNAYYENLQRSLKSLTSQRGYNTYFESWTPAEVSEESVVIEGLKHLFVTQNIDQRIEEALPLIARIQQQENAMKEANIFEEWANTLVEGTWALPDTPEKQAQLIELMSKDLPVGADATNATEQLYDLIGDDQLFNQLENLADRDANADARQVVFDRMQELSDHPDVLKVINSLNIDADYEMNPPAAAPADLEEGRMGDVAAMYDDWINSEYAPMDDEAGDDRAVMKKAVAFLRGSVPDDKIGPIAQLMAKQYHGGDFELGEVKDPATQTEDPAGTPQPKYPEYQDNLADILKAAGVDDTVVAAPNYETGDEETNEDLDSDGVMMTRPTNCSSESVEPEGSILKGQYGHSGKLKAVDKDSSFLDRLKELSGMIRH